MNLGVIGYGLRIRTIIAEIIKQEPSCRVTAIVDVRKDEIREELQAQGMDSIHYYDTAEEMLGAESLDGILIGTRCSLHTPMALKVLQSGIPLYLEKPVSTTMEDLRRLKAGFEASISKVVVSFPLKLTTIVQLAKEIIDSGKIGTVENVQAVNNVPYGGVYYQSWYRDEQETGGLFLQKATHDFDYINSLLGIKPTEIGAMTSKQIFKGTRPAGLKCVNCEDNRVCPDSTAFNKDRWRSWEYCCYAEDTGNEDSGSSLIRYESGMHVSYSQNFFARREAAARGARLLGYKGTLEFDFYTGKVNVFMHHTPRVETYDISGGEGHFGGDSTLAQNFVAIMQNGAESLSPLEDGLLSALMCLKAKESAETGMFRSIDWA
ncbi:Gfo/Idh/MocA family protein [Paenibacillus sepulcri]|uniref:Gfo/Idh/MocA family oxidoreductase n=1 Tax=Paenibacillus sepulcri TaxID=359917 RepID=A0ABS7CCN8_9BACL|nr:Gfo/Idh/MocA family oxidoreductase [Paenibacillus sepulcri]